jgi:5'-nucleotidase
VTQPGGKKVPVVQAYAYTKYLGYLHLEFNDEGGLEEIDGTPILLDAKVQRDPDVLELLEKYRPGILELENEIVGVTKVLLDGNCRRNECNMANLIADAFVDWRALNYHSSEFWTDASIALIQSGDVRTSISHKSNNGNISKEDASTVLPFQNKMEVIEITGQELMDALEHSVHRYEDGELRGEFMQFSGVQVVYDINRPSGNRVVDAKVLCAQCAVPKYENIDLTKKYKIVMQDFLAKGGDGYEMFAGKSIKRYEAYDVDVFAKYLKKISPIHPAVERRITFINSEN